MSAIDTGGPAFPAPDCGNGSPWQEGMNLRDYFATIVDKDEYGDLLYRNASRVMMEAVAGPAPVEPGVGSPYNSVAAYQLAKIDWELRFRAAIRYRMADAMLVARVAP